MISPAEVNPQLGNPYVGPRPFEPEDRGRFFGRDREASEVVSLVIAHRVVLLYAESGAGKSSLINAGIIPRLIEEEEFEVLPPARVRGQIPEDVPHQEIANLYVFNTLLSWAGQGEDPRQLTHTSLADFLREAKRPTDEDDLPVPRVLIFDQFEELFTFYPQRWQDREEFFRQVRAALEDDSLLRVMFVMREDYIAQMDPHAYLFPENLRTRFRLERMGGAAALTAITGPLRDMGRAYADGVAESLVEELLKTQVQVAADETVEVVGRFVEPVQLQVVCEGLWRELPPDVLEIQQTHLQNFGDVDRALSRFYENAILAASRQTGVKEDDLRQWFDQTLITPVGTRGTVFRGGEETSGTPNAVVDILEDLHLIRAEVRAGARWYELTHDRFIEPVRNANRDAGWTWTPPEVRAQQARRRTTIIRYGLILSLVIVAVLIGLSVFAFWQTSEARKARAEAVANAEEAVKQAAIATSRRLAAQSMSFTDDRFDLALLLSQEAFRKGDTVEARSALLANLESNLRLTTYLSGHNDFVSSVAFSPDGKILAAGDGDGKVILWDVEHRQPLGELISGHSDRVRSVAFSPDGKTLASGSFDRTIILWDVERRQQLGEPLTGHSDFVTSVAFSPDGKTLASGSCGELNDFTCARGEVIIWDLVNRQRLGQPLTGHRDSVESVARL